MIENATIYVDDKPYPTRLHEHGKGPANEKDLYSSEKWLFGGHLEGTESTLTALKKSGLTSLEFHREDELTILRGVVWGEMDTYGDIFILHLDWASERSYRIEC